MLRAGALADPGERVVLDRHVARVAGELDAVRATAVAKRAVAYDRIPRALSERQATLPGALRQPIERVVVEHDPRRRATHLHRALERGVDDLDVLGAVDVPAREVLDPVQPDVARRRPERDRHRDRGARQRRHRHHRGLRSPGEGPVVAGGQADRARLRGDEFAAQSGGAVGRAITAARRRRRWRRRDRRDDDRLHRARRAAEAVRDAQADQLRARCGERERQHLAGAQRPLRATGAVRAVVFPCEGAAGAYRTRAIKCYSLVYCRSQRRVYISRCRCRRRSGS